MQVDFFLQMYLTLVKWTAIVFDQNTLLRMKKIPFYLKKVRRWGYYTMTWLNRILVQLFDCHTSWTFLPLLFTYLRILVFVASVSQPIKFTLRANIVREESIILMSSYYCLHSCTVSEISAIRTWQQKERILVRKN